MGDKILSLFILDRCSCSCSAHSFQETRFPLREQSEFSCGSEGVVLLSSQVIVGESVIPAPATVVSFSDESPFFGRESSIVFNVHSLLGRTAVLAGVTAGGLLSRLGVSVGELLGVFPCSMTLSSSSLLQRSTTETSLELVRGKPSFLRRGDEGESFWNRLSFLATYTRVEKTFRCVRFAREANLRAGPALSLSWDSSELRLEGVSLNAFHGESRVMGDENKGDRFGFLASRSSSPWGSLSSPREILRAAALAASKGDDMLLSRMRKNAQKRIYKSIVLLDKIKIRTNYVAEVFAESRRKFNRQLEKFPMVKWYKRKSKTSGNTSRRKTEQNLTNGINNSILDSPIPGQLQSKLQHYSTYNIDQSLILDKGCLSCIAQGRKPGLCEDNVGNKNR